MSPLVQTINLKKYFRTPFGLLHAVDDVNLEIEQGQTLGVVGESGCGKTTLGRTVLMLTEPTEGQILFEGRDITRYSRKQIRALRKDMQIIFQDPYSSLNPRMTVREIIEEPVKVNRLFKSSQEINRHIYRLMDIVGLSPRLANAYPHELDGGRRQRVGIARALSVNPKFIVCDEPVSSLDVSIQAQILNLMMDLREEMGIAYMFITHDLSVVKHISDEIAVMYLGQCVERAPSRELFQNPLHPYTRALLNAVPMPNLRYRKTKREILRGEVTSPINPPEGCRFEPRCSQGQPECKERQVKLREISRRHFVACHLLEPGNEGMSGAETDKRGTGLTD